MDIVFVEALKIDTLIGIYDWERRAKQPVVLDLEMAFDNRVPAAALNLSRGGVLIEVDRPLWPGMEFGILPEPAAAPKAAAEPPKP